MISRTGFQPLTECSLGTDNDSAKQTSHLPVGPWRFVRRPTCRKAWLVTVDSLTCGTSSQSIISRFSSFKLNGKFWQAVFTID